MEPEPPGAAFFTLELEPEPTQVGRIRSRLRDLGHQEPVPPKQVAAPQHCNVEYSVSRAGKELTLYISHLPQLCSSWRWHGLAHLVPFDLSPRQDYLPNRITKKISYKEKCCPVGPTNLFTFLALYRYIMRIHILNTVTTSVVDQKLFIPDPDPALNFLSSGS